MTWREGLPAIDQVSLSFYSFMVGPNQILSFRSSLVNTTTSSTLINVRPVGFDAGIIYLSFSIMIITSNTTNQFMEIISFESTSMTAGNNRYFYANSSIFDYNGTLPKYIYFFQWVTGQGGYNSSNSINYWTYPYI